MEDIKMVEEITEVNNEVGQEEACESKGYRALVLVGVTCLVAGHFVSRGAEKAWKWAKAKVEEIKLKKHEKESIVDYAD